ncbi:MAG TPA: stalk domain-containing protein, partial [Opitutus sp.]|nr:stalk domain-containing protein [Opitutus sp.]
MHGFILGLAVVLFGISAAQAAETPLRATPARPTAKPAAPETKPVTQPPTLTLAEVAKKLGLKIHWRERGVKATLSDASRRLELRSGSREVQLNGLRVFLGDPVTLKRGELQISRIDYETCLVPLLKPSLAKGRGVSAACAAEI